MPDVSGPPAQREQEVIMPAAPTGEAADGGDDLSRQRQKRAARLLNRAAVQFDDVDLKEVVVSVRGATEDRGVRLDACRFLAEQQTIDVVLAYLSLEGIAHPSVWPLDGPGHG